MRQSSSRFWGTCYFLFLQSTGLQCHLRVSLLARLKTSLTVSSCESEMRLCSGNTDLDGDMQAELQVWNSACDREISFSPTTPILSSLTTTYDAEFCTSVASMCQVGEVELQSCSISYLGKDIQKWSSCYCAPSLLSAEYSCNFIANISCLATPATLTDMEQYGYCDNFLSVLGGGSGTVRLQYAWQSSNI